MCAHLAARCRINAETGLPTLPMRGPRKRSSGRATTIVLRVWFSRNVLREFLWIMIWDTAHLISSRCGAAPFVGLGVCLWHKADMARRLLFVRFRGEADIRQTISEQSREGTGRVRRLR